MRHPDLGTQISHRTRSAGVSRLYDHVKMLKTVIDELNNAKCKSHRSILFKGICFIKYFPLSHRVICVFHRANNSYALWFIPTIFAEPGPSRALFMTFKRKISSLSLVHTSSILKQQDHTHLPILMF